jgi:hypothetical protein
MTTDALTVSALAFIIIVAHAPAFFAALAVRSERRAKLRSRLNAIIVLE